MKLVFFSEMCIKLFKEKESCMFICLGKRFKHLEELDVRQKVGKKNKHIGYTKIFRIKEIKGEELGRVSLHNIARYRTWLTISHKCGFQNVQKLLEYIYGKFNPGPDDILQIMDIFPLKNTPYNLDSQSKVNQARIEMGP